MRLMMHTFDRWVGASIEEQLHQLNVAVCTSSVKNGPVVIARNLHCEPSMYEKIQHDDFLWIS